MLVKDLPKDFDLINVGVIVPDEYLEELKSHGITTNIVYLASYWFSGIWVKIDKESSEVYPLQIIPEKIMEWKVYEIS